MKPQKINRLTVLFRGEAVARLARNPAGGILLQELPTLAASGVGVTADGAHAIGELPESMLERHGSWSSLSAIPGWLADSLPDSWGMNSLQKYLLEKLGEGEGAEYLARELAADLLTMLSFVGGDSPVGVEFVPDMAHKEASPVALDLIEAVREARAVESAAYVRAGDFSQLRCGWSAGGARPKTHVGRTPSGEFVTGCGVADLCRRGHEPWLLKLGYDSASDKTGNQSGRMEFAYHLMAKVCGIEMMECDLIEDRDGVGHFITRRFDRSPTMVTPYRSLAGVLNSDKREPVSYEKQWRVRREVCRADSGADEFLRRVVFNVAACVRDDHARNFGYLYAGDGWRQSPAFDLAFCDAPEHSSTVAGKAANIRAGTLRDFGRKIGVPDPSSILDPVVSVCADWPKFAKEAKVSAEMTEYVWRRIESVVTRIRE